MKKDCSFTFRLPAPVKKWLIKEARAQHRSIASLLVHILENQAQANRAEAAE
jgi:hypothetical protein